MESQNCKNIASQIYTKHFLFVDGPQKFLQNHLKYKGVFLFNLFLFHPNQIKDKEMRAKNLKNSFVTTL
jgi:hypothetical protein